MLGSVRRVPFVGAARCPLSHERYAPAAGRQFWAPTGVPIGQRGKVCDRAVSAARSSPTANATPIIRVSTPALIPLLSTGHPRCRLVRGNRNSARGGDLYHARPDWRTSLIPLTTARP